MKTKRAVKFMITGPGRYVDRNGEVQVLRLNRNSYGPYSIWRNSERYARTYADDGYFWGSKIADSWDIVAEAPALKKKKAKK